MKKLILPILLVVLLGLTISSYLFFREGFSNQIWIWFLPILEIIISIVVVYNIGKSIIRHRANDRNKHHDMPTVRKDMFRRSSSELMSQSR